MGHPVYRDFSFLHNLQQRGLSFGRRPVDLIGQKQITHDGSRLVFEQAGFLLKHRKACDVRRQDIRGKLNPVLEHTHASGEGYGHGGLADARNIFY